MLTPLSSLVGSTLFAIREHWFRHTVLLQDDAGNTYAKLSYPGFLHTVTLAEINGESWQFERGRLFERTILISGTKGRSGRFHRSWFNRGGTLNLDDGSTLTLSRPGLWNREWEWSDPQRGVVMKVKIKLFSARRAEITFLDSLKSNALLPMLALLGVHMTESARRRHAAAGAGAH